MAVNGTRPPAPRERHSWAGAGSNVYLFGGYSQNRTYFDDLWAFSTKNASWAQLAPGPSSRQFSSLASSGGLLYLLGGGYDWG